MPIQSRIIAKAKLINPVFQLRFKVNRFNFEVVGNYNSPSLAYGMRKKLCQEQPERYSAQKLYVRIV